MNAIEKNEIIQLPEKYRPLSAWAYFGYSILFSIPIVGLVCLIVFALSSTNINRRSYARSFFCLYIRWGVLILILSVTGGFAALVAALTK